jgi:hypothetical protein
VLVLPVKHCFEDDGSLPCSRESATGTILIQINLHLHIIFLRAVHLNGQAKCIALAFEIADL